MQQQQQELAAQSEQAERDRQAKQLEGQVKNQEDMKKLIAQGRIGMRGQVLDFKKDLALKKLDNKLKERELNQKMAIDKQKGDIDIQKAQQQIKLQAQKAKAKPVAKKK